MSTAYAERSSFERNICSLSVVGWQITHEQHHGLGLCVHGGQDLAWGHVPGEEQDLGAPCGSGLEDFFSMEAGGKPSGSSCKKVIALMNVYKKNYVYRRLSVKTWIYCSLGEMLAVASLVVNGYRAGQ